MKGTKTPTIEVVDLIIREIKIHIVGTSPLVVHKFSEKAQQQMLDAQSGKATNRKRPPRDPEGDYQGAKHISAEGWEGFPVSGFKKAMVRAAKAVGIAMTDARTAFFIEADCPETQLVRIEGESKMRRDMVRVDNGKPDVRFRPEYTQWSAMLTISFNEGVISASQIAQLVKVAGYGVGIGEDRPEKQGGTWGRWKLAGEVEEEKQVA